MTVKIEYDNFENMIRKLDGKESITLGFKSYIVGGLLEARGIANVLVGNYSSIAHEVVFCIGLNHNITRVTTYPDTILGNIISGENNIEPENNKWNHYQICIGHDVWIGRGARILGGVKIGNGAVIGAEAVVAKDVPPYAVVVGNPAQIIKYRFDDTVIKKLQRIKWWYWTEHKILEHKDLLLDVKKFTEKFYKEAILKKIENPTTQCLQKYKKLGKKVIYFIPDFGAKYSVWKQVISAYLNKYTIKDPVLMVIDLSKIDEIKYKKELDLIKHLIFMIGERAPLMVENRETEEISLAVLQNTDLFVTTGQYSSVVAIDYALDYGVKIVSGMDVDIFN